MSQKLLAALRGLVAVVLMLFATNFLPVLSMMQPSAAAAENDKVFVCKYVGTPHVDERLQTGTNPISTSVSSINHNQWNGTVPGWFSDAHDRSYVLSYDNTAPGPAGDPDVSACPAPEGPTVITPPTLHTDVVCGPSNDVTALVDSADSAHYTVVHQGNTYTVTAKTGFTFASGASVTLHVPTDANTACPDVVITPPTLHTDVVCGPNNDDTSLVDSSDKSHYTVVHQGNTYTVTAKDGYTFASGKTVTLHEAVDENTKCPEEEKFVFVCKYVGTPGVDERLQSGQNPIRVSVNSINHNQWNGTVPGWFSDAHDRSYVLSYDNTAPGPAGDPDVSACPAPEGPTVITPPTLHTDVVCGPSNDVTALVDSADSAHYTVVHQGNTYTVTAKTGFTFASGASVTLHVPTDANTACPPTDVCPNIEGVQTNADECGSVEGATDVCPNITGDQAAVPAGMTKDATTGNCITTTVTGGQGGDVLGASTTASPQLANTGQSPWAAIVIGITVIGLTLSSAFVSRKQRLEA